MKMPCLLSVVVLHVRIESRTGEWEGECVNGVSDMLKKKIKKKQMKHTPLAPYFIFACGKRTDKR